MLKLENEKCKLYVTTEILNLSNLCTRFHFDNFLCKRNVRLLVVKCKQAKFLQEIQMAK